MVSRSIVPRSVETTPGGLPVASSGANEPSFTKNGRALERRKQHDARPRLGCEMCIRRSWELLVGFDNVVRTRVERQSHSGPEQAAQAACECERCAAPVPPTAATAARLDASSAPRFAGMKADAKLATRERVSMASARFGVIGAPAARRMT